MLLTTIYFNGIIFVNFFVSSVSFVFVWLQYICNRPFCASSVIENFSCGHVISTSRCFIMFVDLDIVQSGNVLLSSLSLYFCRVMHYRLEFSVAFSFPSQKIFAY